MFQWSKKVVKSVIFEQGVADESLLAMIKSYLEKQPEKTFSQLCKEALWQSLCVPESVKPNPKGAIKLEAEQNIADLKNQLSRLEEYFLSNQSYRLELIEHQIAQLSQQVSQLAITANQEPALQSVNSAETTLDNSTNNNTVSSTPEDIDPLISRLSQFLENF